MAQKYKNVDPATQKYADQWTVEQMLVPAVNTFCNYDPGEPLPNKTSDQTFEACTGFSDCIRDLDVDYSNLMTYAQTVRQTSDTGTLTTYIKAAQAIQTSAEDKLDKMKHHNYLNAEIDFAIFRARFFNN